MKRGKLVAAFNQDHFFVVVDLPQLDLDDFTVCGLHMAADKAGLDGQFAMAAVDQHQQLYAPGAAMVKERVQRRANGPAGVENVVHQNDVATGNVKADGAGNHNRPNIAGRKVVAVEVDIENPGIDGGLLDAANQVTQTLRQGNSATLDTHQPQVLTAVVFFDDLVRQPNQRALDFRCRHDAGFFPQHWSRSGFCFAHNCSGRMIRGLRY